MDLEAMDLELTQRKLLKKGQMLGHQQSIFFWTQPEEMHKFINNAAC